MAHVVAVRLFALVLKPVVVEPARHGFVWADAAIGAAAAIGLVFVVAGVLFLKGDRNVR